MPRISDLQGALETIHARILIFQMKNLKSEEISGLSGLPCLVSRANLLGCGDAAKRVRRPGRSQNHPINSSYFSSLIFVNFPI